jgi:hypothetical protein
VGLNKRFQSTGILRLNQRRIMRMRFMSESEEEPRTKLRMRQIDNKIGTEDKVYNEAETCLRMRLCLGLRLIDQMRMRLR